MKRFAGAIGVGVLVGAIGGYITTVHAQLVPFPSAAPGVTHIEGDVAVTNRPTVLARQDGTWTVTCAAPPQPAGTGAVVATGERVAITYVDGTRETVQVGTVRADGWISVGRRRINLANAIAIEPQ